VSLLLLGPPFPLFHYSFYVSHHVNWDDWHLLAHAMASDLSVAWQFTQREQLVFHYGTLKRD
jgi:hypothetical protein